jgi:hypothetical protein
MAPPVVHDVLRWSGAPLDAATRACMEPRFGQSFADVRIHADSRAAASARAVGAQASHGRPQRVFGAEHYQPQSPAGRQQLAHEPAAAVTQPACSRPAPAGSAA